MKLCNPPFGIFCWAGHQSDSAGGRKMDLFEAFPRTESDTAASSPVSTESTFLKREKENRHSVFHETIHGFQQTNSVLSPAIPEGHIRFDVFTVTATTIETPQRINRILSFQGVGETSPNNKSTEQSGSSDDGTITSDSSNTDTATTTSQSLRSVIYKSTMHAICKKKSLIYGAVVRRGGSIRKRFLRMRTRTRKWRATDSATSSSSTTTR